MSSIAATSRSLSMPQVGDSGTRRVRSLIDRSLSLFGVGRERTAAGHLGPGDDDLLSTARSTLLPAAVPLTRATAGLVPSCDASFLVGGNPGMPDHRVATNPALSVARSAALRVRSNSWLMLVWSGSGTSTIRNRNPCSA